MNPVIRDMYYREVDQLDGKDLIDGEKLLIKWFDGTVSEEAVKIDESSYTVVEHGGHAKIDVKKAYINCFIHGGFIRFYLADNPKTLCERIT